MQHVEPLDLSARPDGLSRSSSLNKRRMPSDEDEAVNTPRTGLDTAFTSPAVALALASSFSSPGYGAGNGGGQQLPAAAAQASTSLLSGARPAPMRSSSLTEILPTWQQQQQQSRSGPASPTASAAGAGQPQHQHQPSRFAKAVKRDDPYNQQQQQQQQQQQDGGFPSDWTLMQQLQQMRANNEAAKRQAAELPPTSSAAFNPFMSGVSAAAAAAGPAGPADWLMSSQLTINTGRAAASARDNQQALLSHPLSSPFCSPFSSPMHAHQATSNPFLAGMANQHDGSPMSRQDSGLSTFMASAGAGGSLYAALDALQVCTTRCHCLPFFPRSHWPKLDP